MASETVLWLSILLGLQSFTPTSEGSTLQEIYDNNDGNKQTLADIKCEAIEGHVPECSECYTCDNPVLERHHKKGQIVRLKLNDHKCQSSIEVCCVRLKNLAFRNKEGECGNRNPDGYPRRLRSSPRAVLQGEYPWRVWIYKTHEPSKSLCAGTFLGTTKRAVLTSASCVYRHSQSDLVVRFDRNLTRSPEAIEVTNLKIHECFDEVTHFNDIALLNLKTSPSWSQSACRPQYPALHGTACIAVSSDDINIEKVLPQQSNCYDDERPIDQSLMCVAGRKEGRAPEQGSGLFCTEVRSGEDTLYVYGIQLEQREGNRISIGTNVTHYLDWIDDNINSQTPTETHC